ncbi:hypothetical protein V5S96_07840 [Corynebacterium mastitidis]|uniref:DUF4013 domain-containing protein n=1 Tax=Corynebacterium mastitidis TaxID=161890 RepID=A0ABU8NZ33_9CORY
MDGTQGEKNAAWSEEHPTVGRGRSRGWAKLDVMEAVRWAFFTVWRNPGVWILGTLLLAISVFAALALLGLTLVGVEHAVGVDLAGLIPEGWGLNWGFGPEIALIPLLLAPPLYSGALAQVSRPRIGYRDFFRDTHYWRVVLISLAAAVFWWAVDYLVSAAMPPRFEGVTTDTSLWYELGRVAGGLLVFFLSMLTHLFTLAWAWYAADGYGFGHAVVEGSTAVWSNAIRLILLYVVGSILGMLGIVLTLLLGALIILPASLLIAAHLCRQANGGELPRA